MPPTPARAGLALGALCGAFALAQAPSSAPAKPLTTAEVLAAAAPLEWRALDPENTLYMELEGGRVVILLAPEFAPDHAKNLKAHG